MSLLLTSCVGEGNINFIELQSHSVAIMVGITQSAFQRYSESNSFLFLFLLRSGNLEVIEHGHVIWSISVVMATFPRQTHSDPENILS